MQHDVVGTSILDFEFGVQRITRRPPSSLFRKLGDVSERVDLLQR